MKGRKNGKIPQGRIIPQANGTGLRTSRGEPMPRTDLPPVGRAIVLGRESMLVDAVGEGKMTFLLRGDEGYVGEVTLPQDSIYLSGDSYALTGGSKITPRWYLPRNGGAYNTRDRKLKGAGL